MAKVARVVQWAVKAFNAWVEGREVRNLRLRTAGKAERFPLVKGYPYFAERGE